MYGRVERLSESANLIRILREATGQNSPEVSEWLRFQAPVADGGKLNVAVAFRLEEHAAAKGGDEGDGEPRPGKRITEVDGKLFIFFPADKETTKLRFHIHGPFASTVARDSVSHGREENVDLLQKTADLIAEALPVIRDQGLLTTDFLGVLPNEEDQLAHFYETIRSRILEEMQKQPLVPKHSGGHAAAAELYRGGRWVREVITDDDLTFLAADDEESLAWAAGAMQNSRADRFLESLGLERWDVDDLAVALSHLYGRHVWNPKTGAEAWLAGQSDEWMQKLYSALSELVGTHRMYSMRSCDVVRVSSGEHVEGSEAYFPEEDGQAAVKGLPRVKAEVLQGKSPARLKRAERFLEAVGVRRAGEQEEIEAILQSLYGEEGDPPSAEEHRAHMQRFVAWWRGSKKAEVFKAYYILLDGSGDFFNKPDEIYLDEPFRKTDLNVLFASDDGRSALWDEYNDWEIEGFEEFCVAVGVMDCLQVQQTKTHGNPSEEYLKSDYYKPGVRWNENAIDRDYEICDLDAFLARQDVRVSRLVWRTMCQMEKKCLQAVFRPNRSYTLRGAPSRLVYSLRNAAWIPDRDGGFHRPAEITRDQLREDFPFDNANGWLTQVELGKIASEQKTKDALEQVERASAAGKLKISVELANDLASLTPEEQKEIQTYLREMRTRVPVQFPERDSANPERRAAKVAAAAAEAPEREYARRERSVRITNPEAKAEARRYLEEMYTNDDEELICQLCEEEMPFKLLDGNYYFEAVEFLTLDREHRENFLALCPTCAARIRYACGTSKEDLRERTLEADDHEVAVELAQEDWTIRFVGQHLVDLRALLEATATA